MSELLIQAFYIFFRVLEIILLLYLIAGWLPVSKSIQNILSTLICPLLDPIRYLLRHSVFQVRAHDISPIIGFLIITYMQNFLSIL